MYHDTTFRRTILMLVDWFSLCNFVKSEHDGPGPDNEDQSDLLLSYPLFFTVNCIGLLLGNHRSALQDVVFARKFVPDHMKALVRGEEASVCRLIFGSTLFEP